MHLLETYALSTGSKIGKPFILKKFFPVQNSKYITIQNSSGMPGKCYDYFQHVIDILIPTLSKYGIGIVQIGGKGDQPLQNVENLQGATNIHQTAHLLSNSLLHLGNDSFAIHMANALGVKTVGLYSITLPEIAGPYFDKEALSICLYPDNQKPSFNPNESPKRINKIKPEEIINSCLKLLFDNHEKLDTETLYIGKRFTETIIECIPNSVVAPEFFKGSVLNIRCDYTDNLDYNIIYQNISIRQCCIVTDKPVDLTPVQNLKPNISLVIYDITNNLNIDFIKQLEMLGITYVCCFNTGKGSAEDLFARKTDLIEYCGVEEFDLIPKDFDTNKLNDMDVLYKSNRIIISNNKLYNSYAACLEDINLNNNGLSPVKVSDIRDKTKFVEDLDYCILYKN